MTIRQAIHDFIRLLELTPGEQDDASRQHTYLRENLSKKLDLHPEHGTFLSGSYSRRTAIRPLNDIDVFCVMLAGSKCDPAGDPPSKGLDVVQEALEAIYPKKDVRRQNRSVNIAFTVTGIAYDVVPAFVDESADDLVYLIPDIRAWRWIHSNPRIHKERSVGANERAEGELKPLTKGAKHWNRRQPEAAQLRSFHLEVMAWRVIVQKPEDRLSGLITLFDGLAGQVHARTPEPAGLGPDLDEDLSPAERQAASERLMGAADELRRAQRLATDGKTEAAHHVLYQLFGDPYPEKGQAEPTPSRGGPSIIFPAPDAPNKRYG